MSDLYDQVSLRCCMVFMKRWQTLCHSSIVVGVQEFV